MHDLVTEASYTYRAKDTLILQPPENFLVARSCISLVKPRPCRRANPLIPPQPNLPQGHIHTHTAKILLALGSALSAPMASSSWYTVFSLSEWLSSPPSTRAVSFFSCRLGVKEQLHCLLSGECTYVSVTYIRTVCVTVCVMFLA